MKMIHAGSAAITEYPVYSKNCNLGSCGRAYFAPVPTITDVQLFVNFGLVKPTIVKFTIIDLCGIVSVYEVVTTDCFIIANNGAYWYGVFKKFNSATTYKSYLFALEVTFEDASTATYFSEQYTNANPCEALQKVNVCYPLKYNDEDINGIYIGEPNDTFAISGRPTMIYQHAFWVRDAIIVEVQNKISFVANKYKHFKSTLNKVHEFRTELVPGWYKDYLLSVYFRGQFFIDSVEHKVVELSFENVLEDVNFWKPYVKLDKEESGSFGCNTIACVDYCPPCVHVAFSETQTMPNAIENVPYNFTFYLLGDAPFALTNVVKPAWMVLTFVGNTIVVSGTPNVSGSSIEVSFTVTNCSGLGSVDFSQTISVADTGEENFYVQNDNRVNNNNQIIDVVPSFYTPTINSLPVNANTPGFMAGTHTGFAASIEVEVLITTPAEQLTFSVLELPSGATIHEQFFANPTTGSYFFDPFTFDSTKRVIINLLTT